MHALFPRHYGKFYTTFGSSVHCTTRKKSEICTPIRNQEFVLHIFALTRKQVFCISPGFHISKLQSELTMHADQVHVKHPISGIFRRACGALADTSRQSSKGSSAASTIPSSAARGTSSCSRTGPPSPTTSTSRSSTMRSTVGVLSTQSFTSYRLNCKAHRVVKFTISPTLRSRRFYSFMIS